MEHREILTDTGTNEVEIADFVICGQHFGINVLKIREFIPYEGLKVVPLVGAHPSVRGVFLLRDQSIPLVQLDVHLKLKTADRRPLVVVVTEFNDMITAFVVDSVNRIHRASWRDFERLSAFISSSSVIGTLHLDARDVLILDLESIMGEVFPGSIVNYQAASSASAGASKRGAARIVFAEDSGVIRRRLASMLADVGFTNVTTFEDGQAALDAILAYKREAEASGKPLSDSVSLLLTDIEMPRMDGLTLCRTLRQAHNLSLPMILYSSLINEQLAEKCKLVGADGYVSKPDTGRLLELLDQALGIN
jgi:two-component system chemotaxis response regulator CheV